MKELIHLKRKWLLLLAPLGLILITMAKQNADFVERVFSLGIYRVLSIGISYVTSLVPVSLSEIIVILLPFVFLLSIGITIARIIKKRGKRRLIALNYVMNLLCFLSVMYFGYVLLCGLNYYRYPFSYYSKLEIKESSVEELYALCSDLADLAKDLRQQVPTTDEVGNFKLSISNYEAGKIAREAMNELGEVYPVFAGWHAKPKPIIFSKVMSMGETTGIFIPYTMEANVNVHIPDYSIPSTMCHELSHLRGFMREDEANFISFLACMYSDHVEFQYSGVLEALILAGNALYRQDVEKYRELRNNYGPDVDGDLIANSYYWKEFEDTVISTVATQVNDTYLKANNQTDGVQSYGRMVDLLLAWYDQYGLEFPK